MFYRETGTFSTSYIEDRKLFPISFDKWAMGVFLLFMVFVIPLIASDYWLAAHLIPILAYGCAALGLNLLTGMTGQLSLGTAGFMCFGAFFTFNIMLRSPEWMNLPLAMVLAGSVTGVIGVIFGLPSIRIKGFYLLVSTLAAQYFALWFFRSYPYFLNYATATVTLPDHHFDLFGIGDAFGVDMASFEAKYLLSLGIVCALALFAKNLMRSSTGRNFMAVRDMDIAASVIGIPVIRTKMLAFFVSCFYCGVGGALFCYTYLQVLGIRTFEMNRSFEILFMVIIGGLGSIAGSFYGTVLVYEFPILFSWAGDYLLGGAFDTAVVDNVAKILYGILIIALLIREPGGLAALWLTAKQKLRTWPFPH